VVWHYGQSVEDGCQEQTTIPASGVTVEPVSGEDRRWLHIKYKKKHFYNIFTFTA